MLVAKQVADILTMARALIAVLLIGLGFSQGTGGLPVAAWLLIASWTSDALDGPLARRSRVQYHTWLGDHDLQVDMAVSAGLLVYMLGAGFVYWLICVFYLLAWALAFWRWGVQRSTGMLFQAPIYGVFIWLALRYAPRHGLALVAWILAVVVLTWPRFPQQVVPEFLEGMAHAIAQISALRGHLPRR